MSQTVISSMANGVPILGIMTKKCKVELISPNTFRIILIQGLNRQIRRMCEHFGYEVIKLERTRIMNIGLKGLPIGDWRDLTKSEMDTIDKLLSTSSGDSKKKIMPASSQKTSYPPKHKSTTKSHKSSNASKFSQAKKTVRRGKK